jgi:hypothetical protein
MVLRDFSRNIFLVIVVIVLGSIITGIQILTLVGLLLLMIALMIPGVFVILRLPWLAQSWLQGINSIWIPKVPWDELSGSKRFLVYLYSFLFFVIAVVTLTEYISKLF